MVFKIIIGDKGKAWRVETEDESILGKSIGDTIKGEEVKAELAGYELMITGGSDNAGFPLSDKVEGTALKRQVLTKGWGMRNSAEGLRLRKTVRGKTLSTTTSQINMKVVKAGSKKFEEVFADQNKPVEVAEKKAKAPAVEAAPAA
ncbi:MAG: S6e family ribosomal protein [archaeon]